MKTFLIIYAVLQIIGLIAWLFMMLTDQNKYSITVRFRKNWKEGGNIILYLIIALSLGLAYGLTKEFLVFEFLSK